MNFKKQYLLNVCRLQNVDLTEFLETYKIPYIYSLKEKDELIFTVEQQEFIAKKLDTIVPYFYGMLDDFDLVEGNLSYTALKNAARNNRLTEHLKSIGLKDYTRDILYPGDIRNPDNRYRDFIISSIYERCITVTASSLPKDEDICLHMVSVSPISLNSVPLQTERICKKAVSKFAFALQYVKEPTESIVLAAVGNDGDVLQIVSPEFHTRKVVKTAIKQTPLSFKYSVLKDYDICLEAVSANGINLEFVPDEFKDHNIIITALNSNGWALMFLDEQTEEYALTAVLQNTETALLVSEDIRNKNSHIQYIYEIVKQRHSFLDTQNC